MEFHKSVPCVATTCIQYYDTPSTHRGYISGYYFIPPLVLLPVARDSGAGVCASLLSYLTRPKRVRLARDPEILRASLACQRCSGLGILLLLEQCELLRCPVGMLDQGHWCADMAVQWGRISSLYRSLQQVLFCFHHKSPPNHYTTTTKSVYFCHTATGKTLSTSPPNTVSSIGKLQTKTRLVTEENYGPVLHPKAKWCRAQFRREVLCRSVSSVLLYGLRAFKPQRFSRFRTV